MGQPGGWIYNILPFIEQEALHQLGSDEDPDNWTTTQLDGSAQRIQTPLEMLNCPSRRRPLAYPIGFNDSPPVFASNYTHKPYGSAAVSRVARSDYAGCVGDQFLPFDWYGPGSLAQARTMDQNNSWPKLEVEGEGFHPWKTASPATGIFYMHSAVLMAQVTDGTSSTYMLGEKYLDPDHYETGTSAVDNESMYCGNDDDIYRTTYPSPPPMQDTPGYPDRLCYFFGSAHAAGFHMCMCDGSVRTITYSIDPEIHRRLGNRRDGLPIDGGSF